MSGEVNRIVELMLKFMRDLTPKIAAARDDLTEAQQERLKRLLGDVHAIGLDLLGDDDQSQP